MCIRGRFSSPPSLSRGGEVKGEAARGYEKKDSDPPVYYPVFLDIHGKRSLVIGGGKVALRKVKMLLECGANVSVISPKVHPDMVKLSREGATHLVKRDYEAGDLKGAAITIACTEMKEVNRKVADEAKKVGVPVNVADDPELSDFVIPSFFRRGALTIAASTSGVSPALARKMRIELEKSFGEEYASLLPLIGEVRSTLKKKGYITDAETRQEALDLDLLIQLVRSGQREKARAILP